MKENIENKTKELDETVSFEAALVELESIVRGLESGSVKLDEALSTYERGVILRKFCQDKLESAKLRIEKLSLDKQGNVIGKEDFSQE